MNFQRMSLHFINYGGGLVQALIKITYLITDNLYWIECYNYLLRLRKLIKFLPILPNPA